MSVWRHSAKTTHFYKNNVHAITYIKNPHLGVYLGAHMHFLNKEYQSGTSNMLTCMNEDSPGERNKQC